jgi:hypothetical protein
VGQGEVENISKTLASWSAHALSMRPGNLFDLVNINLFKGLTHIGYGERDHTVVQNSWCSHVWFNVASLKASIESM